MSILIVDDSVDNCLLIQSILKHGGYKDLATVHSADDALQLLKKEPINSDSRAKEINLIIMDVYLPGINGITACGKVKEMPQYEDLPIIIISADSDVMSLQKSFEAGAIDFIRKPLNRIELLARVRSILRLKEEIDRRKGREEELIHMQELLKKSNEVLRQHAIIDSLTGVFNRRYFDETLRKEWQRSIRNTSPISLILIDVDYFKGYNDGYGHQKGDECLRKIASSLTKTLKRSGDMVARYGGEEFVAVLPETDRDGAMAVASKLEESIAKANIPYHNSKISDRVTVSMGVATTVPDPIRSFSIVPSRFAQLRSFIESADKALFFAKDSGRDQIKVADESKISILEL